VSAAAAKVLEVPLFRANIRPLFPFGTGTTMTIDAPEIIEVDDTRVKCEGVGGALGHPRVYLEMGDENSVECPYCDRKFVLKAGAHHH
jgi:uncharacterized Zn-finger protein